VWTTLQVNEFASQLFLPRQGELVQPIVAYCPQCPVESPLAVINRGDPGPGDARITALASVGLDSEITNQFTPAARALIATPGVRLIPASEHWTRLRQTDIAHVLLDASNVVTGLLTIDPVSGQGQVLGEGSSCINPDICGFIDPPGIQVALSGRNALLLAAGQGGVRRNDLYAPAGWQDVALRTSVAPGNVVALTAGSSDTFYAIDQDPSASGLDRLLKIKPDGTVGVLKTCPRGGPPDAHFLAASYRDGPEGLVVATSNKQRHTFLIVSLTNDEITDVVAVFEDGELAAAPRATRDGIAWAERLRDGTVRGRLTRYGSFDATRPPVQAHANQPGMAACF
jgi:hypothetical protein